MVDGTPSSFQRPAQVAGRFYSAHVPTLQRDLARLLDSDETPRPALGVVLPHAGWTYSGAIAGDVLSRVQVPERAVVICPNHTGLGSPRSLWPRGSWCLPDGDVDVDEDLASHLLGSSLGLEADVEAHCREHAIEVLLPLLRARQPRLRIVPICLGPLSKASSVALGVGIARVLAALPEAERPLLVASTDMSHFLTAAQARESDAPALERVGALDPEGLHDVVTQRRISMCGYVPTTVVLSACRELGAGRPELVRYGTSGDVTGDDRRVVAYAGFLIPGAADTLR